MSEIAIKVENVGKSYILGHHAPTAERYTALRDVITRNVRSLTRKTRDMLHGKTIVQGDEVEEFWALKNINLEIKQGERIGIIGRNGAGKSTLLKILSRITEPTKGRVTINGRVASLLEVGTGFHPELSGRENIFLNGAILGMSKSEIQKKFDEIVDFSEVGQFLDTPVKRYSSGMYVRLAFSVAAHLEPDVLIVDEVLAVGDAAFQEKCFGKLQESQRSGKTVLFVSHNMNAVAKLCDKAILLEGGMVSLQADCSAAIQAYLGSVKASSCVVNLSKSDHLESWGGSHSIQVYKLKLIDGVNDSFKVYWNQKIVLEIELKVFRPLSNVTLSIGISSASAGSILSSHHTENDQRLHNFEIGRYRVRLEIENPLRQGFYLVALGADTSIGNSPLFHIPEAATIEVLNLGKNNKHPPEYAGLINTNAKWELPIKIL